MKQIPTAEEYLRNYVGNNIIAYGDITHIMIEFAKLHVEAALKEAANEYYPKDKPNFELVAERFINAYPLENIK